MSSPTAVTETLDAYLRRRRRWLSFLTNETYAAVALALATVAALVWANTGESYHAFWSTPLSVFAGSIGIELTVHQWVDEGLMTAFFFMVGLDVRRDLTLGDLRLPGHALLPVAAALGGLIVPALIYVLISQGTEATHAWGTVISTDTAFALGMLAVVGPKKAPRLRLFLLAFAVIDDIGALLVIALFYSESLNLVALGVAVLGWWGSGAWPAAGYGVLPRTWSWPGSSGTPSTARACTRPWPAFLSPCSCRSTGCAARTSPPPTRWPGSTGSPRRR